MNSIDFLPTSYHEERIQRNIAKRRILFAALTALTLMGWGITRHQQSADLASRAEALKAEVSVTQQRRSEMDKLREERKSLIYQQDIQLQLDQSIEVSQVVAVLDQLMSDATTLTQVRINAHRPPPKPLEDPDEKKAKRAKAKEVDPEKLRSYLVVEIHGMAPDDVTVADLVNTMNDLPLFEKVTMHFSRVGTHNDLIIRRFRIGAEIPLDRDYQPLVQSAEVPDDY